MTSAIAAINPETIGASSSSFQVAQTRVASPSGSGGLTASLTPVSTVSVSNLSAVEPTSINGTSIRETASSLFTDLRQSDLDARPQKAKDALNSVEISSARAELAPSPWKVDIGGSIVPDQSAAEAKVNSSETLRKSFDHALFITMVTQVVGGMSQTTNNLLRQP